MEKNLCYLSDRPKDIWIFQKLFVPAMNSIRQVKYNPDNPSQSVLAGSNRNNGLIFIGAFFILGGMVFVLIFLQIKGVFDKIKIDIIGLYIGVVFVIIGIGILAFQMGTASSLIAAVKAMGLWVLIPIMFMVVGSMQTIKCLKKKRSDTK